MVKQKKSQEKSSADGDMKPAKSVKKEDSVAAKPTEKFSTKKPKEKMEGSSTEGSQTIIEGNPLEGKKRKKRVETNIDNDKSAPGRNFGDDLAVYVAAWADKEQGSNNGWKFNKVLQSWALDHCLDDSKVNDELFPNLLEYLKSVRGIARDRLYEQASKIIAPPEEASGVDEETEVNRPSTKQTSAKTLFRACLVRQGLLETKKV